MSKMDISKRNQVIRAGCNVRRFHTELLINSETVGHHSASVALLCLTLTDGRCSKDLLVAALKHDLGEQFTGDIPAPAKRANHGLKEELLIAELNHPDSDAILHPILTGAEEQLLKAADLLDLGFKCVEEIEMGNRTARRILNNVLEYCRGVQLNGTPLVNFKLLLGELHAS